MTLVSVESQSTQLIDEIHPGRASGEPTTPMISCFNSLIQSVNSRVGWLSIVD